MKELSEKAKRYDEALKKAKDFYKGYKQRDNQLYADDLESLFPELKESEDERIRRELIAFVKSRLAGFPECDRFIDWLESQVEHANFRNKIQVGDKVTRNEDGVLVNLSQLNRVAKKQGEQKPADTEKGANGNEREIPIPEPPLTIKHAKEVMGIKQNDAWSEEDEENMMMIEDRLSDYLDYIREDTSLTKLNKNSMKEEIIEYVNWLKSLKERVQFQNRWKPSERQKEALLWCVVHLGGADKQTLGELLEELNKL